jgi:hypothetical protein
LLCCILLWAIEVFNGKDGSPSMTTFNSRIPLLDRRRRDPSVERQLADTLCALLEFKPLLFS